MTKILAPLSSTFVMSDSIRLASPAGRHPAHQEGDGSRVPSESSWHRGAWDDEQHFEYLVEGRLVHEFRFRIEEGAFCSMSSVYRAHEKDANLDVRFFVTLEKNATFSLDIASFLLGERSKSDVRVFLVLNEGSRVTVRQLTRAEGSSSVVHEEIRGLAIGEYAHASFIPELELLHDDVLATHAASIVRVDEKRVAYLLARGVSREDAVGYLAEAFLQSTVSSRPPSAEGFGVGEIFKNPGQES